jgi:hypothetical protein
MANLTMISDSMVLLFDTTIPSQELGWRFPFPLHHASR